MKPEHVTIGIDLGTTNTCVAVIEDGRPTIIPDGHGNKTTPSMVALGKDKHRLVGYLAKRQSVVNAENTIYASKRLIGQKWDSDIRLQMEQSVPYKLTPGDEGSIDVVAQGQSFSASEVGSMILAEMKMIAEQHLGYAVKNAVITVPAYFNDAQRQATKIAGRMAGLDVLRVLNEPTAAALAYGFEQDTNQKKKKLAVYDLGGGTFDISILEYSNGIYEVISTAGDTFLGGEDFDKRVVDWMVEEYMGRYDQSLFFNPMTLQRLKEAAEKARWELSEAHRTDIHLPFLFSTPEGETVHLRKTLTRAALEDLTNDLVERTIDICMTTLSEAYLNPRNVDEVLLVGGMTRMPRIRELVQSFFGRAPSTHRFSPDEVVAKGAAVQGYSLVSGGPQTVLLDVTPHSLGIMIAGGFFNKLIEKNTTVPCRHSELFSTVRDEQTEVKIYVLQGESFKAEDNDLLGEFIFGGLPAAPRGQVDVQVTFEISADGIVSVSATDPTSGRKRSIRVKARNQVSEDDMNLMLDQNLDYVLQAKADKEFEKHRQAVELDLRHVRDLTGQVEAILSTNPLGQGVLEKAAMIARSAEEALETRDLSKLLTAAPALQRTRMTFRQIIERASQAHN